MSCLKIIFSGLCSLKKELYHKIYITISNQKKNIDEFEKIIGFYNSTLKNTKIPILFEYLRRAINKLQKLFIIFFII